MERHKCKLCSRTFSNGRALGGHMKAHLASLKINHLQTESTSSSSSDEEDQQELLGEEGEEESQDQVEERDDDKALNLNYGLRENPRKSFKFADPDEFSSFNRTSNNDNSGGGGSSVFIQDGESETESKTPVRKRSKQNSKRIAKYTEKMVAKEPRLGSVEPEQEPVSSVSDISAEEDVAMCLVMLSRDRWRKKEMKHQCETCNKVFRSSQALGGHRVTHRKNSTSTSSNNNNTGKNNVGVNHNHRNEKVFECPFCYKVFGSGQALGGHKRSHLIGSNNNSGSNNNNNFKASTSSNCLIDLNLPAPEEEDEFSVVSDAELVDGTGI